jgi:hypothetical protein
MALISVGNFCQSVKNNSILLSPGIKLIKGQKQKIFVSPDILTNDESAIFDSLCSLLGLEFGKHLDNYGISIFDESLQHTYYTSPSIGLGEGGVLGLMIGASDDTHKNAFLPLVYDGKPDDDGLISGDYSIVKPDGKKVKCALISIPNPMDSTKTNHYIGIKNKVDQFQIPFKAASSDLNSAYINECWDEGHFQDVCKNFLQSSGSLSKMFKPCFIDGYFPSEGVLMLLANGQVQPSDQYGASSRWTLKWVSHPELIVNDITKDNPIPTPLVEIGSVFAPKSCKATSYCVTRFNKGQTAPYYVLHIKGLNKNGNNAHIPDHAGCDNIALLDFVLSDEILAAYPEVKEKTMALATTQISQQISGIKQNQLTLVSAGEEIDELAF